jgi:hypothetical protein
MTRGMAAVLLAVGVLLRPGQALTQPVTEEFRAFGDVEAVLWSLSEALPAPGRSLRANVVSSSRYAVSVSDGDVTVTSRFLREASRSALAAIVAYHLLPDPVYFAITMDRAGFDGPGGLVELNERLLYDVDIENVYRAAVNVAYVDMMQTIFQNSFWVFARPGYHLMYRGVIDAATVRYYQALAAYKAYLAARPPMAELPPITSEFIGMAMEVTDVLRGGDPDGVSSWRARIEEALKVYPPRSEQ